MHYQPKCIPYILYESLAGNPKKYAKQIFSSNFFLLSSSMKLAPGPNSIELLRRKYCLANLFTKQNLAENQPEVTYIMWQFGW